MAHMVRSPKQRNFQVEPITGGLLGEILYADLGGRVGWFQ